MSHEIYIIVTDALNNHALDCKCYICTAFTDALDGSRGHAAACNAVAEKLYGARNESAKD